MSSLSKTAFSHPSNKKYNMKLSQFNFKLPKDQVALYPHKAKHVVKTASGERTFEITRRDESRLMVLHKKSETIEMYKKDENGKDMVDADGNPVFLQFKDIVNYFEEGDTFIFNNTKVFPARLYGTKEKTDAKIEVFLLRELNPEMRLWDVLVEPARKIRIGNKLFFDDVNEMVAEVIDNTTSRAVPSVSSMMRMAIMMSSSVRSSLWARLRFLVTLSMHVRIITLQRMIWTISSVFSLR